MNLRWQTSLPLSFLHAAVALYRRQPLADPALAEALTPGVDQLSATMTEERLDPERFLGHLLPLSITQPSLAQLAEVALTKTLGRTEALIRVPRVQRVLHELREAFTR